MNALVHAHSGLRWVLLALVLVAIIKGFGGLSGKKPFSAGDKKVAMFAMIMCHIQLVIGLILYFITDKFSAAALAEGNRVASFFAMEHIGGMILGIILVTIGYSTSKRGKTDKAKFKRIAIWYTIGLLVILGSIPWPFMKKFAEVGIGWF
jgi:uncharacterized membrane protein